MRRGAHRPMRSDPLECALFVGALAAIATPATPFEIDEHLADLIAVCLGHYKPSAKA